MSGLRVLVVGGTGYIGRHVVEALVARGHRVLCIARRRSGVGGQDDEQRVRERLRGAEVRFCDVTSRESLTAALAGTSLDAVVSCLATRSGGVRDAWRIERDANLAVLDVARAHGARHFQLLSAICVQRPKLAFQFAKLEFEAALKASGLSWSIIRPTAFFKSLAGQVERVRTGRPFLVFGDGQRTACKPIGEADLARFMAEVLVDEARHGQVLIVAGPGPAITPRQQAELLARALDVPLKLRAVPPWLMDVVVAVLSALGALVPALADKAEFARIGRYYATESMLVLDPETGTYRDELTPSYGTETLAAFYARVARDGVRGHELGDHAVGG
ncbi:MAG: NAD(P)H-binding protein [Myxococcaceae bacterium]|nr:NAD(P)H-binding protein [Myxococcaceae bacterium]MCA3012451.1 NAD(P)H-binding protein [Myxococcaceae bacterium]